MPFQTALVIKAIRGVPAARTSAWYFGNTMLILVAPVALVVWAFRVARRSQALDREVVRLG